MASQLPDTCHTTHITSYLAGIPNLVIYWTLGVWHFAFPQPYITPVISCGHHKYLWVDESMSELPAELSYWCFHSFLTSIGHCELFLCFSQTAFLPGSLRKYWLCVEIISHVSSPSSKKQIILGERKRHNSFAVFKCETCHLLLIVIRVAQILPKISGNPWDCVGERATPECTPALDVSLCSTIYLFVPDLSRCQSCQENNHVSQAPSAESQKSQALRLWNSITNWSSQHGPNMSKQYQD